MDKSSLARLRELEQKWTERLKAMREEQTHAVRGRYEDEARILGHRIEVQDRALRELAALLADTQEPESELVPDPHLTCPTCIAGQCKHHFKRRVVNAEYCPCGFEPMNGHQFDQHRYHCPQSPTYRQRAAEGHAPEDEQTRADKLQCAFVTGWREGYEAAKPGTAPHIHLALEAWDEHKPAFIAAAPRQEKEECENGVCPLDRP